MLTAELITTLGGSVAGFVMKLLAIRSQQNNDLMMKALDRDKAAMDATNACLLYTSPSPRDS